MSSQAFAIHLPESLLPITPQILSAAEQMSCAANEGAMIAEQHSVPIAAAMPDGSLYDGDLLSDVVEYRGLRNRELRRELETNKKVRLHDLERALRGVRSSSGPARLRAFHRYECSFTAEVQISREANPAPEHKDLEDGVFTVQVVDVSAGGLKADSTHPVIPGVLAFVVLSVGREAITFPARIAWVRSDSFGLMFAGAAGSAPGKHAPLPEPT